MKKNRWKRQNQEAVKGFTDYCKGIAQNLVGKFTDAPEPVTDSVQKPSDTVIIMTSPPRKRSKRIPSNRKVFEYEMKESDTTESFVIICEKFDVIYGKNDKSYSSKIYDDICNVTIEDDSKDLYNIKKVKKKYTEYLEEYK